MVYKLNILHLLIALGAAGGASVLLLEASGRLLHPSRLSAAPLQAAIPALFLLAIVAPELREPRLWAAALALGALAGAGHLGGRAVALYLRTATAPHRDLVRR